MEKMEEAIRGGARNRIAQVFRLAPETLSLDAEFGKDLKASFVSEFKNNEFDRLSDDIGDVADRVVRKQIESGKLVIRTVADYCDHMVRCHQRNPEEVRRLLDPHHPSKLPRMEEALRALGKRLVLSLQPAVKLATPATSARSNTPPNTRARTGQAKKRLHPSPRKRVPVAA